ncbi:hypothetical protein FKR81_17665 [Lentzea tibetensis]|uniref:DUF4386 family protein n=1 Tax=Lentzea tibetensis TaxID=2591470 RepID=A0A563ET98_9PSEU|nr:hypothetical protein [Lentzea tibetensis]TWP50909.1 hypothetical protein FKR81_17665 [Lentzea tibetensis]
MRRLIGALLTLGGVAVVAAASLPSLLPVWRARGVDAVAIIGQHVGAWQLSSWLFAVGAALTLAGFGALNGVLERTTWSNAGLALMTLATALWMANLAFRLTVTVRVAEAVRAGGPVPEWYEPINAWTGGLLAAAAVTAGLALLCYGVTVLDGVTLPSWTGWLGIGFGVLVLGLLAATNNVPPILLYLAPLAFGIGALIRRPRLAR